MSFIQLKLCTMHPHFFEFNIFIAFFVLALLTKLSSAIEIVLLCNCHSSIIIGWRIAL